MSNWGKGSVNNAINWGKGAINNNISWGKIYFLTYSGQTNITGSASRVFDNSFDNTFN
mgnify:FL=1|tara:strand:+ start:208 stop:381 length:174 start_codon:yes stop_codon:yes gene_type:complete